MSNEQFFFTSESVTEGHPDKVADAISDSILDAIMEKDTKCRVACESLVTTGLAFIAGEITTDCYVDMPEIVRSTIREIGYHSSLMGFDWQTCSVITSIDHQSQDIAQGVNVGEGLFKDQGAGDQGLMFGFATDETPELMPMSIMYAHKLCQRLATVRKNGALDFLRPDGKSQVTVEYENGTPRRVDTVVVSTQHKPDASHEQIREAVIEEAVEQSEALDMARLGEIRNRLGLPVPDGFVVSTRACWDFLQRAGVTDAVRALDTAREGAPDGGAPDIEELRRRILESELPPELARSIRREVRRMVEMDEHVLFAVRSPAVPAPEPRRQGPLGPLGLLFPLTR